GAGAAAAVFFDLEAVAFACALSLAAAAAGAAFSADAALTGFAACAAGRFLLAEADFCLAFMSTGGFGDRLLSIRSPICWRQRPTQGAPNKACNSIRRASKRQILFLLYAPRASRALSFDISN